MDSKRDRIYQELSEIQWQWKNIRSTVECHLKDSHSTNITEPLIFLFYFTTWNMVTTGKPVFIEKDVHYNSSCVHYNVKNTVITSSHAAITQTQFQFLKKCDIANQM